MKPVACAVDGDFGEFRSKATSTALGNFPTALKKSPRHVLVVDDEPLIRWSVTECLSEAGCDVEQAADAASALRKVTTNPVPFDVVVLDLRLPDMDDLSLLATLRQLIPMATLILMTAFGTPAVMLHAASLGATVLDKPFELDDLKSLVLGDTPDAPDA